MDSLEDIYDHITALRKKGVKMKDIASHIHVPASVLSALYSTVLPAYLSQRERQTSEGALDFALSLVNNVSRKRLMSDMEEIKRKLISLI